MLSLNIKQKNLATPSLRFIYFQAKIKGSVCRYKIHQEIV